MQRDLTFARPADKRPLCPPMDDDEHDEVSERPAKRALALHGITEETVRPANWRDTLLLLWRRFTTLLEHKPITRRIITRNSSNSTSKMRKART
jgi:hypothetical protein